MNSANAEVRSVFHDTCQRHADPLLAVKQVQQHEALLALPSHENGVQLGKGTCDNTHPIACLEQLFYVRRRALLQLRDQTAIDR